MEKLSSFLHRKLMMQDISTVSTEILRAFSKKLELTQTKHQLQKNYKCLYQDSLTLVLNMQESISSKEKIRQYLNVKADHSGMRKVQVQEKAIVRIVKIMVPDLPIGIIEALSHY